MIAFIDDHREVYGVEPICRLLPIAPITSTSRSDVILRGYQHGRSVTRN